MLYQLSAHRWQCAEALHSCFMIPPSSVSAMANASGAKSFLAGSRPSLGSCEWWQTKTGVKISWTRKGGLVSEYTEGIIEVIALVKVTTNMPNIPLLSQFCLQQANSYGFIKLDPENERRTSGDSIAIPSSCFWLLFYKNRVPIFIWALTHSVYRQEFPHDTILGLTVANEILHISGHHRLEVAERAQCTRLLLISTDCRMTSFACLWECGWNIQLIVDTLLSDTQKYSSILPMCSFSEIFEQWTSWTRKLFLLSHPNCAFGISCNPDVHNKHFKHFKLS